MKANSASQLVPIGLLAVLVFALCGLGALAQDITWVKNKETLAPKGTLQLSGNLEMLPLATMTCNVTPTTCDNVHVLGAAILDGRLVVSMTGTFARSSRRTLLDAHGGRMGIFSLVKIDYPTDQGLKARITYDANHVYLEIALGAEGFPPPLATQTAHEIKPTPPAVSDTRAPGTPFLPTVAGLTFAERVAYQYAIEDVCWRHRIWPKDNPGTKPPLDAVIPRHELERKVEDYLRKSQAVADRRGWEITTSELQAEMNRMARDTKQPVVLQELFAALGNDPFIIAECLARPLVAERLVSQVRTDDGVEGFVSNAAALAAASAPASQAYGLPEILDDCTDDTWTAITTVNAPQARSVRRSVWTGSEMIIWGGSSGTGLNTGGRYDPSTDTWTATSTTNAPTGRGSHTLVWTGTEMIAWGGFIQLVGGTNTGGRYNPITDSWVATSTVNAPDARFSHTAVWTGSEMIVWGGVGCGGNCRLDTGGKYNPTTDSWTATNRGANLPEGRWNHTAAWTGEEMIVWGGTNSTIGLNTGGKYNPATDSWTPTSTAKAPLGRVAHTSIWSGSEMDVWGGVDSTPTDLNTGGRYNPTGDSWMATGVVNAPSPRDSLAAVWTGSEMIVWGGVFCCPAIDFNTGGRYNPGTDSWIETSIENAPHTRDDHTAVWTGSEMIVWGGRYFVGGNVVYLNTGGTYCAQSGSTPTPTPSSTPTATATPTATPTATLTPRPRPVPRARPSPAPRP